jgi:hypothetical protein
MKKLFLFLVLALFVGSSVNAQKGLSFGLRAIPTLNWVSTTDTDSAFTYSNDGTKIGIGFGPSVRYKFSDNFNVDISGIFTWQKFGFSIENQMPDNNTVYSAIEEFKLQYIQVPLNFNGQFDVATDFKALINFGAGAGILLNSSRLVTHGTDYSTEYDPSIKMLTFVDIYLTAGAGVVYDIEDNLHLSLTVQYNNGILDGWLDNKDTYPLLVHDLNLKHKNIAFSLGFYIDL